MQAGRELDRKVAEALGYYVLDDYNLFGDNCFVTDEAIAKYNTAHPHERPIDLLPHYSTTWKGMGVLVEEARKQDIYIDILPQLNCYICEAKAATDRVIGYSTQQEAPYAVCLAYLDAHGISV